MRQFYWLGVFFLLVEASKAGKNKNSTYVEAKSASEILNRFHQSDYQIKFEWAELVHVNKSYGTYTSRVFKYNRTTTALNVSFVAKIELGYNLEMQVQAYKFASNEYRQFPIRLRFNFCESMRKNVIGYSDLTKCGNFSCPLLKGRSYHYCNWAPDEAMFPPFIPSGRYMLEIQGMYYSDEVYRHRYYGAVTRSIAWT